MFSWKGRVAIGIVGKSKNRLFSEELDHRPEPDVAGHLRGRGDEQLLARRHAEVAAVMLGEVVAGEARLVSHPNQLEAILEQPARRGTGDVFDVIEDAELAGHDAPS
jgi:hypothetical protein